MKKFMTFVKDLFTPVVTKVEAAVGVATATAVATVSAFADPVAPTGTELIPSLVNVQLVLTGIAAIGLAILMARLGLRIYHWVARG